LDSDLLIPILVMLAGLSYPLVIVYVLYLPHDWMNIRYLPQVILAPLIVGVIVGSAHFIHQTSVMAYGDRYYTLYDDGMISMRYAWNFSHGYGLVWNPGEYVEGYTNPLMVLLMSVWTFLLDKSHAVLAVQVMGLAFALGNAGLVALIARQMSRHCDALHRRFLQLLSFACALLYFPLVFWPLTGGDLGPVTFFMLLGVLAAFKVVDSRTSPPGPLFINVRGGERQGRFWGNKLLALRLLWREPLPPTPSPYTERGSRTETSEVRNRWLYVLPIALGLSYLTRADAAIPGIIIMAYFLYAMRFARRAWLAVGIYALFPLVHTLFRLAYYGEIVPNTYTLKLGGVPLELRLPDGLAFLAPFWEATGWLLVFIGVGAIVTRSSRRVMVAAIAYAALGYQIYVGGDITPFYWRLIAYIMPLVLLFYVNDLLWILHIIWKMLFWRRADVLYALATALVVGSLLAINHYFLTHDAFEWGPVHATFSRYHVTEAAILNQIMQPEAVIGVTGAGITPYYTHFRVVDFLGKNDSYIAHLPPRLFSYRAAEMQNYPGHIKYDLLYSIFKLRPDFVEVFGWGNQNFTALGKLTYYRLLYDGVTINLRKDSKYVRWDRVKTLMPNPNWPSAPSVRGDGGK
jgi:arabinofuranosyltransferase